VITQGNSVVRTTWSFNGVEALAGMCESWRSVAADFALLRFPHAVMTPHSPFLISESTVRDCRACITLTPCLDIPNRHYCISSNIIPDDSGQVDCY